MEPEELAGALKRLADWATEHAPQRESPMRRRRKLPPMRWLRVTDGGNGGIQ